MANYFAIKSGNFSDPTVWSSGIVPTIGDDVFANGFAITIDINRQLDQLRNDNGSPVRVVAIATPIMTSNSQDGYIANASSFSAGSSPYYAFDQSIGTSWFANTVNTGWLSMQFPTGKIIKRYAFYTVSNSTGHLPVAWSFQGSNDGTNWTSIQSLSGQSLAISTWYVYDVTANTTSYTYYRINVTATSNSNFNPAFGEFQMTESDSPIIGNVAGGSYILNGGVTLTCTNATPFVTGATTTFLTYNAASGNTSVISTPNGTIVPNTLCTIIAHTGTGALVINGNIASINGTGTLSFVTLTNIGTITINGNLSQPNSMGSGVSFYVLNVTGAGTVNINGNISSGGNTGGSSPSYTVFVQSAATVNVTGNLNGSSVAIGTANAALWLTGNASVSIVGNITGGNTINAWGLYSNATASITITGNVTGGTGQGIYLNAGGTVNITGIITGGTTHGIACAGSPTVNVTGNVNGSASEVAISAGASSIVNITGNLTASLNRPAVGTTTATAIVTVAGNLVNTNGMMAFYGAKMFIATGTRTWFMTLSDNTTQRNLLSADQIVVAGTFPAVSDVRSGVVFALTQTGTCAIPPRASVAIGVPVDQTVGSAPLPLITLADLWDYPVSSITTANTIGARLKNVATVDITGEQIAAFNR